MGSECFKSWYDQIDVVGDLPTTTDAFFVLENGERTSEQWARFCKKYEPYLMRYARNNFGFIYHLSEDAYRDLIENLITTPELIKRKPNIKFRRMLLWLYHNKLVDILRKKANEAKYIRLTHPLRGSLGFGYFDMRLLRQCIAYIKKNFLSEDNVEPRELFGITDRDRMMWVMYHEEGWREYAISRQFNVTTSVVSKALAKVRGYLETVRGEILTALRREKLLT